MTESQRSTRLEERNATTVRFRTDTRVESFFEEQAERTPDAPAVLDAGGALSYGELERRANRLAQHLIASGAMPGQRVALCLERGPDAIVTLVAILKAGCAYLPLEPTYPSERMGLMLEDAAAPVVVTTSALAPRLPRGRFRTVLLDQHAGEIAARPDSRPPRRGTAEDGAYVMYTSGSTGKPKGAEIGHRAINRLVLRVAYVQLGPDETLLHAAPLAFDASTFEIWGALLNGGRVALHPEMVPTAAGLRRAIAQFGVTTMWLTAALFNAVIDEDPGALSGVRQLLTGGEALSVKHVRRAMQALPATQLINGYGPTECTTFAATYAIPRDFPAEATSVPIGRPIRDTQLYVLNERRELVSPGEVGELYIGGDGLALGYLGRPELTAERFVPNPFRGGERLYRTGDLVRELPDGLVDYLKRIDTQVKIRGFRIELGEIEAALARHPGIANNVVLARDHAGSLRLVAYCVASGGARPSTGELARFLEATLPAYMVPATFVWMDALPVTPNGKVDRRALPAPESERPALANDLVPPEGEIETALGAMWGELLGVAPVGATDNFFELGGNSLLAMRMVARWREQRGAEIPVLKVFEKPTIRELARFVQEGDARQALEAKLARVSSAASARGAVAIVGMACRYPGAPDVRALWRVLCKGRETVSFFTEAELDAAVPAALRADPRYVRARGILKDVDRFDAGFFGIPPREAEIMDPQQRLMLEVAWEALENAGHVPETFPGVIGIWAGKYNDTYWSENVVTRPDLIEALGAFQAMVANEKDYIATRVAHRLNLTGPAISVHTACSTSLVAIAQAFRSVQLGECDLALAGGVAITVPVASGHLYQEGAMLSADGHTRSFDARGNGTVFSDGAGVVVLRRLEDALRDGDTVYAVIRGAAINNDGSEKASFTAPSVEGQATVIARAQADAGVDPRSISYVEAHGTATPLGDPIEVEALTRAFRARTPDVGFCGLGSIKSNFGHTVIAAGVAGVIKTALALANEVLPPSLHFEQPNPKIDFERSPFRVVTQLVPWPRAEAPRRAGVSSFGVGGTNAHVVLEEAPAQPPTPASEGQQLVVLSARTEAALDTATRQLADFLEQTAANLADVAFTLQAGRRAFRQRRAVVAPNVAEAVRALRDPKRHVTRAAATSAPQVVFMFPGQGSQYVGMGRALHAAYPACREALDRCFAALKDQVPDLRDVMFAAESDPAAQAALRATRYTQPALFAIEYAVAAQLMAWGVTPKAMVGHSVGEFVAAALAGVMPVEEAARLVAARGQLMQDLPEGAMLSVRLPAAEVEGRLSPRMSIASINAPALCVVAGPREEVDALQKQLESEGAMARPLHTSHAFHSPMMDPAVPAFTRLAEKVPLSAARIPFVSTMTGTWITAEQARDPGYWGRHLRATVRFADAVATLWKEPNVLLLEVGPRTTLSTLARQQVTDRVKQVAASTLGESPDTEEASLVTALGQLWTTGVPLDIRALHTRGGACPRRRVPLPTYPFERQRFWLDPAPKVVAPAAQPAVPSVSAVPVQAPPLAAAPPAGAVALSTHAIVTSRPIPPMSASPSRIPALKNQIRAVFEETSGIDIAESDSGATFLELGFDSLFLTQVALALQRRFEVKVTFRQLIEDLPSLDALADFIDSKLPAEAAPAPVAPQPVAAAVPIDVAPTGVPAAAPTVTFSTPAIEALPMPAMNAPPGTIQNLIEQQLRLMQQQLQLLQGNPAAAVQVAAQPAASLQAAAQPAVAAATAAPPASAEAKPAPQPAAAAAPPKPAGAEAKPEEDPTRKPFGAIARISLNKDDLSPKQRSRLEAFTRRYTTRTKESKKHTQENRAVLADPRVVTGFRPAIKELVYPIVVARSKGSRVWDLDGNEYVDTLNGFGCNLFGWQPDFVTEAVKHQLDTGHEIGPQTPLAAECARLICDFTGFDRAGFCNTGSEAVMGCIRIARTVTGRQKLALFAGSYHGIFDEVIVRATKSRAVPAAPGIMPQTAENVLVLDYGTPETLAILKARANELAAVLVEPVQSRRPDFQPREFLREVRKLTEQSGTVLIFDEVITGFRTGPGGAQEFYGIRADLASYGKVIGGGLPVGVIAGKRQYMDALDGGHWEFGDASVPTVGVTYFAGTFVRHPLALAAVKAVLLHLKKEGPALQKRVSGMAERLARELNAFFKEAGVPLEIRYFTSLWKTFYTQDQAWGDLLFCMLRDRGVHILDGFPCFFTTAHTDADVDFIVKAFKESVGELQEGGFLPETPKKAVAASVFDATKPPVPEAKLGRDPNGNPAWYVPNPKEPGKYVKLDVA